MNIEELKKLAKLSRIKLNEEELALFPSQMKTILDSVSVLNELDTSDVKSVGHNTVNLNDLREDIVCDSLPVQDALSNAPYTQGGFVKVYGKVSEELEES